MLLRLKYGNITALLQDKEILEGKESLKEESTPELVKLLIILLRITFGF